MAKSFPPRGLEDGFFLVRIRLFSGFGTNYKLVGKTRENRELVKLKAASDGRSIGAKLLAEGVFRGKEEDHLDLLTILPVNTILHGSASPLPDVMIRISPGDIEGRATR